MALPATDNFNRADGGLGANWTGSVGADLQIVSNEVVGTVGSDCSMYWSADAPDAAQYAQVTITNTVQYRGPLVRTSATDWVALDAGAATDWKIEWYNSGDWTQIGSTYATAPADNDVAKITADGTAFKGYINGTERISGSNASAPASGYGGIYIYYNGTADNFEVGNLGGTSSASARHAYIKGSSTSSSVKHSYLKGQSLLASNKHAYLAGTDTSTSVKHAYLAGQDTSSEHKSAFLAGQQPILASVHAYMQGISALAESGKPAYLSGQSSISDLKHAYAVGQNVSTDAKHAYLVGQDSNTSSKHGYIAGEDTASGSIPAYIAGASGSIDSRHVYLAGKNEAQGTKNAYLIGEQEENDSRSAYIAGRSSLASSIHGYLEGIAIPISSSKNAYIAGQNSAVDNRHVYLTGQAQTTDSKHSYLIGKQVASSSVHSYLASKQDVTDGKQAYVRGQSLISGSIHAYLAGGVVVSSNKHAYISGIDAATSSKHAYVASAGDVVSSSHAYLSGIQYQYIYPDLDLTNSTGWQNELGGSSLYPSIDEHDTPNDSDYVSHPAVSAGNYFEVRLENLGYELADGPVTIHWRASTAGSCTLKMELYEGATLRASDQQVLTGTATTFSYVLTAGEKSSITDWDNLSVRFMAV